MKFTVFADLHYKKKMYISSVEDLNTIFDRANAHSSEAVICLGDFCNDFCASGEIVNAFLNNRYGLAVYNVYGNHELETVGNTMEVVTPLLTNRKVNWGGEGAEFGYYWFDTDEYRFIALDTNYSFNPDMNGWEHNREGSWGAPGYSGWPGNNTMPESLGDAQLEWLKNILFASAEQGRRCIILSHAPLCAQFSSYTRDVRVIEKLFDEVNAIRKHTVMLCINGHLHTDSFHVRNGVVYLDVNTVRSGAWKENKDFHYEKGQGFEFVDYDSEGKEKSREYMDFNDLRQGKNTWFFDAPLSADITLEGNRLTVKGSECGWYYGVEPDRNLFSERVASAVNTKISSHSYIFED